MNQTIIGLEVHVQLATTSKLFCGCSTRFGAPPNTQTCPVCLGLPGTLPVMNEAAYRLSLETAVALNCEIPAFTKWDRKQYYYPDLPKGYQISQYDLPMSHDGYVDVEDPKERFQPSRVGIIRAHLEVAAGVDDDRLALLHDPQTSGGLLLAAGGERAEALEALFERDGAPLWEVGRVASGEPAIAVR